MNRGVQSYVRVSGKPDIRGCVGGLSSGVPRADWHTSRGSGSCNVNFVFHIDDPCVLSSLSSLSLLSHLSLATRLDLSHSSLKVRKRLGVVRRPGGCTRHPRARPGSRSLRRDAIHPLPQRRQPRARRRPRPRRRGRRARRPLRRGHPREPLPVHLRRAPVHVGHGRRGDERRGAAHRTAEPRARSLRRSSRLNLAETPLDVVLKRARGAREVRLNVNRRVNPGEIVELLQALRRRRLLADLLEDAREL